MKPSAFTIGIMQEFFDTNEIHAQMEDVENEVQRALSKKGMKKMNTIG